MSNDENVKSYQGEKATVTWDRRLCIHVGECGRADNDMFVGGRKPWCSPDAVDQDTVDDVVRRCPTGALAYEAVDGTKEAPARRNTVVVANHGPLYVTGELDIEGVTPDMPGVKFRAALCRCGLSKNKPFCDNSHEGGEFRDRGAVGKTSTEPLEDSGGVLRVKQAANGPLLLEGNVAIVSSSGRVAWQGTKCALCRCGQSKNKPFCDGTHRKAGFEAP